MNETKEGMTGAKNEDHINRWLTQITWSFQYSSSTARLVSALNCVTVNRGLQNINVAPEQRHFVPSLSVHHTGKLSVTLKIYKVVRKKRIISENL